MNKRLLLSIVLLAIAVRLWGISWGLPDKWHPEYSFHPDEAFYLDWARGLYNGEPYERVFMYGGTFHPSILKFSEFVGTKVPGDIPLRNILLVARLFSLVAGVITVVLVFYIGKILYGDFIGLLAALFLAILPAHVYSSQQAKPDVIMASFSTAAIFFSLRGYQTGRMVWSLLSGFMIGMATGTKISAMPFLFVPIIACILRYRNLKAAFKEIIIIPAAFIAGYLIISPHTILYPNVFYEGLKIQYYYQSGVYEESIGRGPGWLHYALRILPYGLGIPLLTVSLVGLAGILKKRESVGIILVSAFMLYYALISWGSWVTLRYTTPLHPLLGLFAALAFAGLTGEQKSVYRALQYTLLVFTVCFTLLLSLSFDRFLSTKDTRTVASEWIEANIKPGSVIGLAIDYEGDEFFNPPINIWKYRVQYQILRESYNMNPFLSNRFDYIIVNEYQYLDYMRLGSIDLNNIYARFFDNVMNGGKYRLIKEFKKRPNIFGIETIGPYPPSELIIPSPTIRIYKRI